MPKPDALFKTSPPDAAAARQMRAWLALVGTLALHVVNEALTGVWDSTTPSCCASDPICGRAPRGAEAGEDWLDPEYAV